MRMIVGAIIWAGVAVAEPVGNLEWRFVSDQVMGGVSTGQAELRPDGLRLTGDVSTANNGGFIQVRTAAEGFDPSTNGISLRVRGDGQRYFIHLRTVNTRRPWQYYQAAFQTTGDWQEIALEWDDFKASGRALSDAFRPEDVRSFALVAYGRDHRADVTLQSFQSFTE